MICIVTVKKHYIQGQKVLGCHLDTEGLKDLGKRTNSALRLRYGKGNLLQLRCNREKGPVSAFTNLPQDPEASSLKPIRRFIPPSWKTFFHKCWRKPWSEPSSVSYSPEGEKTSLPLSPFFDRPQRIISDREEISNVEDGSDFKKPPSASTGPSGYEKTLPDPSYGDLSTGPPSYKEKLEAYDYKYSYMKSWPGLLRLMGGLELILGGMVFACTAAYIQKDYQWSQLWGGNLPYNGLTGGGYGYNYYGPMTPFVLVVVSLSWLVTVILLGLGVTMYYRTILLNSHWWPLTEFGLNLLMFLLYMAAAIAYVNDVNRGGLCYSVFANNPLIVALCRVEGGQMAAIAFLFITTLLYLTGSLVCLKMWRHEAARKRQTSAPRRHPAKKAVSGDEIQPSGKVSRRVEFSEVAEEDPALLNCSIPTGHHPKPHVIPDYVMKYPAIRSLTEQEKYKAVFKDQYAEYKELYHEVRAARQKLKELGALMAKLPHTYQNKTVRLHSREWDFLSKRVAKKFAVAPSHIDTNGKEQFVYRSFLEEQSRVSTVWREYENKKTDPAYLEKLERCDYLKKKLTHIKAQIQAYDGEAEEDSVHF
ncbi:PREDICTED: occludin/ELL domain-containing protein 1 [Gekko japonicus]|uniref:Occludin/ELL domain-containing protein 1 n=1 Tax=Gekko japonicus TaxID=146911 RepID=A0ABM1JLF3_GEKJA|nr:PREDICTED: occludin/ELL domain-containing protein 1 [Gekko japonicus]